MRRVLTGHFIRPRDLVRFGLGGVLAAVILFAASAALYPQANEYDPLACSASYLGSFEAERNPGGWWVFSLALVCLGLVSVSVALYRHRRIAERVPTGWALWLASTAVLVGAYTFYALAFIPDVETVSVGSWTLGQIHDGFAALSFWSLGVGMTTDGFIFLLDRKRFGSAHIDHARLKWPYLAFAAVGLLAGSSLGWWYVRCKLDPSLKHWPGEGLACFPAWEWILLLLGPVLYVWVAGLLGSMPRASADNVRS
ncbi:MAG: hypothetical protein O2894_07565 [Planctomycetota bacterium]|nr:hypothetical protein [Planctomycetota bacterium]